jgi:hypothetical protein
MIISISTTAMASSRQFTGGLGMAYEVETSTNLTAWTSLGTITNTTRTMSFADLAAANQPQRFYRAVWK